MESYMIMELNHLLAVMYNELDTQKRVSELKFTVTDLLYQTNNAFFQFCIAAANTFSEFLTEKYQADNSDCGNTTNRARSNTPSPSNLTDCKSTTPQPASPTFRLLENVHRVNPESHLSYGTEASDSSEHSNKKMPQQLQAQSSKQTYVRQNFQTYQQEQQQPIRGPSPIQGYFENLQGPLPNPGQLAKVPFISAGSRPFPFFQINVQRRWSECTGSVDQESNCDNQIRRWSMPTQRFMPMMPRQQQQVQHQHHSLASHQDFSQSTTPDSTWHSSVNSQDGLLDAIHLLSIKPMNNNNNNSGRRQSSSSTIYHQPPSSTFTTNSIAMPIIYSHHHTGGDSSSIEVTSSGGEEDRQNSPQPNPIFTTAGHYPLPGAHYGQWWAPNPISDQMDQIVENAGGEEEEKH